MEYVVGLLCILVDVMIVLIYNTHYWMQQILGSRIVYFATAGGIGGSRDRVGR